MPTVYSLIGEPKRHFLDNNADPASGAQMFVYTAGSSSKVTTYTESDGVTANANPVVLDSRGEPPNGVFVESGSYKLVLAPSTDTDPPTSAFWTRDNISPVNDTSATFAEFEDSGLTPTYVSGTQFTVPGDQTSEFHLGRRLKAVGSGTVYGVITASAFTSLTTVTIATDSGTLDVGLATVSLSVLSAANSSLPHVSSDSSGLTVSGDLTTSALDVGGNLTLSGVFGAQGDILQAGSGNVAQALSIGTAGQVLKVNSGATAVEWGAGGALVEVQPWTTLGSDQATIDIEDLPSGYGVFILKFHILPATDGVNLSVRFQRVSDDGYDSGASDYRWVIPGATAGVSQSFVSSTTDTGIRLNYATLGNTSGSEGMLGTLYLSGLEGTSWYSALHGTVSGVNSSAQFWAANVGGQRSATTSHDGVRLICSSGDIASGSSYGLWGVT